MPKNKRYFSYPKWREIHITEWMIREDVIEKIAQHGKERVGWIDNVSSVQSLSHIWLFATPWTTACQAIPVHHQLPEFTQTHVHWVSEVIQPSHLLSSSSPPVFILSQHQGLLKWVSSSLTQMATQVATQVAKALEFQLQHQSFQWTPRTDLL